MKLPILYIVFEQVGSCSPTYRTTLLSKKEAEKFCKSADFIPHSGRWFYKKYKESK